MSNPKLCPCVSGKNYQVCCGRFHKGKLYAPTAESLMRSRYSAYVLNNMQYIYRTWDKTTRPPLNVLKEDNSQIFTHLEIINTSNGNIEDKSGTVEFIARYTSKTDQNTTHKHHENSYFQKQSNKWKYVNELDKVDISEKQ